MLRNEMKLIRMAIAAGVFGLVAAPAFASRPVLLTANFTVSCTNCQTDISGNPNFGPPYSSNPSGPYSVQDDLYGSYSPSSDLESQILTNNTVYTLDTTGTLNTSLVRTVSLHFFSPVEGIAPGNVLPSCWQGVATQEQAVNLSVFSSSVGFPQMQVGTGGYGGFARVDFNDYSATCFNQVNKFTFHWYNVCITHPTSTSWVVTTDVCGATIDYGTGNLQGQGGKKGQTINYGDWRVPFQLTLTSQ